MMGPPGAGKGTQATFVADHFGIPAISTGDIFRANVSSGTPLGAEAKRHMETGEYVPDAITNKMVRNRIEEPDAARGFLLDGYPRTLAQVEELDGMLGSTGQRIDAVLCLAVAGDAVVERLMQRARIEGRADDTEGVIRRRQQVYLEQTAPLVELYKGRGSLVEIDGGGEIQEVAARALGALGVVAREAGIFANAPVIATAGSV